MDIEQCNSFENWLSRMPDIIPGRDISEGVCNCGMHRMSSAGSGKRDVGNSVRFPDTNAIQHD